MAWVTTSSGTCVCGGGDGIASGRANGGLLAVLEPAVLHCHRDADSSGIFVWVSKCCDDIADTCLEILVVIDFYPVVISIFAIFSTAGTIVGLDYEVRAIGRSRSQDRIEVVDLVVAATCILGAEWHCEWVVVLGIDRQVEVEDLFLADEGCPIRNPDIWHLVATI